MTNFIDLNNMQPIQLSDIVVHDSMPSEDEVIISHDPEHMDMHEGHDHAETFAVEIVGDNPNLNLELPSSHDSIPEGADIVVTQNGEPSVAIDLGDIPGAPPGTEDPEPVDEVEIEEDKNDIKDSSSSNEASSDSNKKNDKWDWKSQGFGNFTIWIKDRFNSVPRHTGYDTAGLERAQAYLQKLHGEVSKAMRSDIDGELEAEFIADIHKKIDDGIEKLESRLEKVRDSKSSKKKKKSAWEEDDDNVLIKNAQKSFGVKSGTVITVSLFISTLARTLVNGTVSAGKDMEHSYQQLVKKYKLNDREKIELIQLVQDMGFPLIKDRSVLPEDGFDPRSTDNLDFLANYQA